MASDCTISLPDLLCSWEEDRKLVLRGWSLVFIFLATLLVFSVVDGRMAYVHGPYTGFIGLWIDCRRHKCANVGQFTVYTHMSKGFIFLALALCLILLPTMFLSFRPVCRRLNKIDFIFSFLSIGIAFCPSLAPPQCRAPDSPQPDALCHRLQQAAPEATGILPAGLLPVLVRQRLDAVGRADVELQYAFHGEEAQLLPLGLATPLLTLAAAVYFGQKLGARPEAVYCKQLCELPRASPTEGRRNFSGH
nr:uncharacterized protein LOC102552731 isoform X6 [Rattus norvegicus]